MLDKCCTLLPCFKAGELEKFNALVKSLLREAAANVQLDSSLPPCAGKLRMLTSFRFQYRARDDRQFARPLLEPEGLLRHIHDLSEEAVWTDRRAEHKRA
jgi:hypothetical protein